jgi:hypothetical protein
MRIELITVHCERDRKGSGLVKKGNFFCRGISVFLRIYVILIGLSIK